MIESMGLERGEIIEMRRRTVLAALSAGAIGMSGLTAVRQALATGERREDRTPALFVGHGSPMNAIEDTPFSRAWVLRSAPSPGCRG